MTPLPYARAVAGILVDPVGVYLHGSAVLGGFRAGTSDVDMLAVVSGSRPVPEQRALGEALAAVPGCPGTGLEMSVITSATAASLGACRFEVHVNTTGTEPVVVPGGDRDGDPDLVLHAAVCRDHGLALVGPPPDTVFGPVPPGTVLAAMLEELSWGLAHASPAYVVLNGCRALRYAREGRLCSKIEGGRWYLERYPDAEAVVRALDGGRGLAGEAAARFADGVRAHLHR